MRAVSKKFTRELMVRLADRQAGDKYTLSGAWNEEKEDFEPDLKYEVIVNEWYDNGRWKSQHDLVFLDLQDNKYYHTRYENGLTESQHYSPFDGEDEIYCDEVTIKQVQVTTVNTTWETIFK